MNGVYWTELIRKLLFYILIYTKEKWVILQEKSYSFCG